MASCACGNSTCLQICLHITFVPQAPINVILCGIVKRLNQPAKALLYRLDVRNTVALPTCAVEALSSVRLGWCSGFWGFIFFSALLFDCKFHWQHMPQPSIRGELRPLVCSHQLQPSSVAVVAIRGLTSMAQDAVRPYTPNRVVFKVDVFSSQSARFATAPSFTYIALLLCPQYT